jgi:hypothetical protein
MNKRVPRILLACLALALLCAGFLRSPRTVSADAPGQPSVTNAAADSPASVGVSWYNSADGKYGGSDINYLGDEYELRFDLRYGIQGDTADADYIYICSFQEDCNVSPQSPHVIYDDLGQPPFEGYGHYEVTGLNADSSYCFELRSVAREIPAFGDAYTNNSDWSAPRCAHTPKQPTPPPSTPVPLFGAAPVMTATPSPTPAPTPAPAAAQTSVIRSPQPLQTTHDVLIDVVRAQQDKDDGVFDLQWGYSHGGRWFTLDSGPLDQLDKGSYPGGVTLSNSLFTDDSTCAQAAPCASHIWRVRAHLDGVAGANGPIWSDWVVFYVCTPPRMPSGAVCA